MQVLKFGGSSVANAANMSKVVDIVTKAVDRDRTILVSSAISGCTDTLIKIGHLASERDESYKELINDLQGKHHDIIRELLPREKQEESLEVCDSLFDSLRSIAQGVFLLGELSPASLDAIQSFGELWSTKILATKLASIGIETKWIDSRKIIRTIAKGDKNAVDIQKTYYRVNEMVENNHDPRTRRIGLHSFALCSRLQGTCPRDLDRCTGHDDLEPEDRPYRTHHQQHIVQSGPGALTFRSKGHLSTYHPACCGRRHSYLCKEYLRP